MAGRKYVSYEVEPVVMASLLARFGPIRAPVQVLNGSRGAGRGVSSNHERQTRLITPDIALRPIEVPWAICTPLSPVVPRRQVVRVHRGPLGQRTEPCCQRLLQ